MMRCSSFGLVSILLVAASPLAWGQTSSLGAQLRRDQSQQTIPVADREAPQVKRNAVYGRFSWVTGPERKPKTFSVGDLITVIVRERRQFEADSELLSKKRLNIKSDVDAFVKVTGGGIGASDFRRGKPSIDVSFDTNLRSKADTTRDDNLTLRLTGKIIDVKPNGVLMIEARARVQHDEEISVITVIGGCRKEDVTADNTILSTQLADKTVSVINQGALRAAATRGWILRILDYLKPV